MTERCVILHSTLKNVLKTHGMRARGRLNNLSTPFSFLTLSIALKTIYFRFHSPPRVSTSFHISPAFILSVLKRGEKRTK